MLKFYARSVDGERISEFNTIEEFENQILVRNIYKSSQYVTNYGDTYTPDDATIKAINVHVDAIILEHELAVTEMKFMPFSLQHDDLNNLLGINQSDIAKLILNNENKEKFEPFIQTELGRVFLVPSDSNLHSKLFNQSESLSKIGLSVGSLTLKDTFTLSVKTPRVQYSLVVDTRSEALDIDYLMHRSIEKSRVVVLGEIGDEDYNSDAYKLSVFGDDEIVSEFHEKITSYDPDKFSNFWHSLEGFSNSESNPITESKLHSIMKSNKWYEPKLGNEIDKKLNGFFASVVDATLINAAGSVGFGLYVEKPDGAVEFVKKGDYLKVEVSQHTCRFSTSTIENGAMNDYTRLRADGKDAEMNPF